MKPLCIATLCLASLTTQQCFAQSPEGDITLPPTVNLKELHRALSAAKLGERTDEEKTASYLARVESFRFKKLGVKDEMTVVIQPKDMKSLCRRHVDADRDLVSAHCEFSGLAYGGPNTYGTHFNVSTRHRYGRSYVAANAFNRKVTARESLANVLSLVALPGIEDPYAKTVAPLPLEIVNVPSEPHKYKQTYDDLEIAIVFKLVAPYAGSHIDRASPTISDPYDYTHRIDVVYSQVDRIYYFRKGHPKPLAAYRLSYRKKGFDLVGDLQPMLSEPK